MSFDTVTSTDNSHDNKTVLNAALTPITWIFAGCVLGYAERLLAQRLDLKMQDIHRPKTVIGALATPQTRRTEI